MTQEELQKFERMMRLAESGDVQEQFNLGEYYRQLTPPDYDKALYWYLKTTEREYPLGELMVGLFYLSGYGTKRNPEKAVYWLEKAVQFSHMKEAKLLLGDCYRNGIGVVIDLDKAEFYWKAAGADGHELAESRLASLKEFREELKKAAEENFQEFWCAGIELKTDAGYPALIDANTAVIEFAFDQDAWDRSESVVRAGFAGLAIKTDIRASITFHSNRETESFTVLVARSSGEKLQGTASLRTDAEKYRLFNTLYEYRKQYPQITPQIAELIKHSLSCVTNRLSAANAVVEVPNGITKFLSAKEAAESQASLEALFGSSTQKEISSSSQSKAATQQKNAPSSSFTLQIDEKDKQIQELQKRLEIAEATAQKAMKTAAVNSSQKEPQKPVLNQTLPTKEKKTSGCFGRLFFFIVIVIILFYLSHK